MVESFLIDQQPPFAFLTFRDPAVVQEVRKIENLRNFINFIILATRPKVILLRQKWQIFSYAARQS